MDTERERACKEQQTTTHQSASTEETIGLFGGRRSSGSSRRFTRLERYQRLKEILVIISRYDVVHGLTPQSMRMMLEELGPTFVKAGQILSMRSEILPESFCQELTRLRTDVDPMTYEEVLQTLRAEYDRPLEELFDAIDPNPLGSASVAQVHIARLTDGTDVAVKVQRPGVRETMAQDIDIMRSVVRHLSRFIGNNQFLDIQSVIEERWASFRDETDFLVEASNLEKFRSTNKNVAFVTCPKPYKELCTEHVVVMDYIRGIPISDTSGLVAAGYDLTEIGEKLVDNYAHQVLDVGFFHADPHPGNIIISGGKIAFIDLGIIGRLSSHNRLALRDIMYAVAEHNTPLLKSGLLRFAASTDTGELDHAQLLSDLDQILDDYGSQALSELNVGGFIMAIITLARRNGIELPGSITMFARSMVTLEGVLDEFIPEVSMIDILAQHVRAHESFADVISEETNRTAYELHEALHGVLGAASELKLAAHMLTRGQLSVNMRLAGSEDPISDMAHAADRLTMGIIIAGLFIGSSVIYYARIQPVILGVPVIGFVGYLIALWLGLWIVRDIMREARRRR